MAPLKLPCLKNVATLGTVSELGTDLYKHTDIEKLRLRKESQYERDTKEERMEGDRWSEIQQANAPEIDNKLVQKKFRTEMRFIQPRDNGKKLLDWYHGNVTETVNKREGV